MEAQQNQLALLVADSGLEQNKAQTILEKFQDYYKIAADWEEKAKSLKVVSVVQTAEMKMAREGRLFLKNKRVEIEKTRKDLKEQSLREGKAIDGIANVLKALIEPIEEYLEQQEKYAEIKAAKEKEERKVERINKLIPFQVSIIETMIAEMSDADFDAYYTGIKSNYEARIEAERKAEEERVAKEKAEVEERERIRQENERLRAEAAERERVAEIERQKQAEELRIQREQAEKERAAAEEKARKEREEIEAKARAEREEQERKIAAERAERERVERELQAKREAEEKAAADAEQKLQLELSRGDAEKFEALINDLELLKAKYSFKSNKFISSQQTINELLNKAISYAMSIK